MTVQARLDARPAASLTRVEVDSPPGGGRVCLRVAASGPVERPVVRPLLIGSDRDRATVSLVPEGALLLAGDAVRIVVRVGAGTRLELIEPGGTVAYPMSGGQARWDVRISLGPASALTWAGEPFVISAGAVVHRRTTVTMDSDARLAVREVIVLGRHGEGFGDLRQQLHVTGPDGAPVLSEALTIGPDSSRWLTGGARAMSTVMLLGDRLPATGEGVPLDLDAAGTVVRGLADQAHRAMLPQTWVQARSRAIGGALPG